MGIVTTIRTALDSKPSVLRVAYYRVKPHSELV